MPSYLAEVYRKEPSGGRSRTAATKGTRRERAAVNQLPSALELVEVSHNINRSSSILEPLGGGIGPLEVVLVGSQPSIQARNSTLQ